jgi:prepilin-type N-terminal cleavage/methylation domain-containing protein
MRKKAFTLIEIMIALIIVGILATLGLPFFQNVLESSKEKVCDTNLEAIKKAVDIYVMEHDSVPGSISELKESDIEKAYASVFRGKDGWKKRLAYLIVEGPQWGLAYAQGYGLPHLRCPSNPNTATSAISYGLNLGIANMASAQYKALNNNTVVVADSDATLFYYPTNCPVPGFSATSTQTAGLTDYQSTASARAHKQYQYYGSVVTFLKGLTKNGQKGRIGQYYLTDNQGNYIPAPY